jgi:hypothetical protein
MINYDIIGQSVSHYSGLGYERIEAPWWVSTNVLNMTTPEWIEKTYYLEANKKCLVASGEQSYLYMMVKDRLPVGRKYQTVTPCFRDESIDFLHKKCFIKNELIVNCSGLTIDKAEDMYHRMREDAFLFFKRYLDAREEETYEDALMSTDIVSPQGVELGSYGIREHSGYTWVYGTGVAEPRLSRVLQLEAGGGKIKGD